MKKASFIPPVALLLASLAGASPGLAPAVTHCQRIEINTYGPNDNPRTALVYWGHAGNVIDWRFPTDSMLPQKVRPNLWAATWTEYGMLLRVTAENVTTSRTLKDVEWEERQKLPEHKRQRLRRNY